MLDLESKTDEINMKLEVHSSWVSKCGNCNIRGTQTLLAIIGSANGEFLPAHNNNNLQRMTDSESETDGKKMNPYRIWGMLDWDALEPPSRLKGRITSQSTGCPVSTALTASLLLPHTWIGPYILKGWITIQPTGCLVCTAVTMSLLLPHIWIGDLDILKGRITLQLTGCLVCTAITVSLLPLYLWTSSLPLNMTLDLQILEEYKCRFYKRRGTQTSLAITGSSANGEFLPALSNNHLQSVTDPESETDGKKMNPYRIWGMLDWDALEPPSRLKGRITSQPTGCPVCTALTVSLLLPHTRIRPHILKGWITLQPTGCLVCTAVTMSLLLPHIWIGNLDILKGRITLQPTGCLVCTALTMSLPLLNLWTSSLPLNMTLDIQKLEEYKCRFYKRRGSQTSLAITGSSANGEFLPALSNNHLQSIIITESESKSDERETMPEVHSTGVSHSKRRGPQILSADTGSTMDRDRNGTDSTDKRQNLIKEMNYVKSKRGGAIEVKGEKSNVPKETDGKSVQYGGLKEGSEFECLKYLAPNITVEETDSGEILIRRANYGIMIQQEDLKKYIKEKLLTNEGNETTLPFRALYRYTDEEYHSTAGLGLCSILAIVGILCPALNSTEAMASVEGRRCIATSLEQIVIPALEMYRQELNFDENPNAHEHNVYKDVTIQHLTNFIELLRNTSDIYVASDKWMETSDVGIIIQALPHAAVYWQEIGDNNWVALNLWSNVATRSVTQNIHVLKELLMESTGHIVFGCKHFFNILALLPLRYTNLVVEVDFVIDVIKNHSKSPENTTTHNKDCDIGPEYLDTGTVSIQKNNSQWFIGISKDKMAKLSKLTPVQIKDKILNGNVISIHKKIHNVNWSLIRGDGTCGYQSLHAVALHATNKSMDEISRSTKTSDKPRLLIKFLQRMVPQLQSALLANSLSRVLKTIDSLQNNRKINISHWCPTEIMEEILPTLHPNSRCWYHTRPPVRSAEWISTYFSSSWLSEEQGLDIVFNGSDHFTIQQNNEIERSEIEEGINNLIEVITKAFKIKGYWTIKHGMRNSAPRKSPEISVDDNSDTEIGYIKVVRGKKSKKKGILNNDSQKTDTDKVQAIPVATTVVKALYSISEVNARMKAPINYAPKYHPLDDPLPTEEIEEIPFPKKARNDNTAWKYLVEAPSRLGKGQGVYTLTKIPMGTVIMEYIDEDAGKEAKDITPKNSTGTAYMYVNEVTSTRIDATNNKESYCGIVNEAFEEKNFNTIICEKKIDGKLRVFLKTTREINAKEEIGTRYTNDGSYWRKSQHSDETMSKVYRCYNLFTPKKRTSEVVGNNYSEERTKSPRKQLFRSQEMEEEIKDMHTGFKQGKQEIGVDTQADCQSDELWADISQDLISKEGSEDYEVHGSDEGRYSNTIYQNTSRIELNADGLATIFSYDRSIDKSRDIGDYQDLKESNEECKVYDSDEEGYNDVIHHSTVRPEIKTDSTNKTSEVGQSMEEEIDDCTQKTKEMDMEMQADTQHKRSRQNESLGAYNKENNQNLIKDLPDDIRMEQSNNSEDYEVNGSDEGGSSNTICHSRTRIEINKDGTTQLPSYDQNSEGTQDNHNVEVAKAKRKRAKSKIEQKDPVVQRKRSKNRSKKSLKENNSSTEEEELPHSLERERLESLTKDELIEYCMDQRCRHKKMLLRKLKPENQGEDSKSSQHKKKASEVMILLLTEHEKLKVPSTSEVTCQINKVYGFRKRKEVDYSKQLDLSTKPSKVNNRTHKEPLKPRFTLNDTSVMNDGTFMIAQSGLKHKQQGVFSREVIPMKRNRILFEYRSEHGYGTRDSSKVASYLSSSSDNKYMVNIGNIIVDAVHNTRSYCNYVQELLNHKNSFNCKYAKTGDSISIVQIAPIGKYEELNIQFAKDGEYWRNRTTGYPEAILKRARKFYHIEEPTMAEGKKYIEEIPDYISKPKNTDQEDYNLMDHENLFRWTSSDVESNLRIGTLNINGALFDSKNDEPYFAYQLMTQCGLNILGLTDTRTPTDKEERVTTTMRFSQPKGTAVICFPTQRIDKESSRLTTMGGQMFIVDRQWEPYICNKKSDASGLSLITSISITYSKQTLVIIQLMVPPVSTGECSMWERIKEYLKKAGIRKNPRDYVLDTASRWHINEKAKGYMVVLMGDFNRSYTQMHNWESQNNLVRAHEQIEIAQVHPNRKLYTFLRNDKIHTHIDHIYYSSMESIRVADVGATDHPHIHEKTDHFPIWIGLHWKCKIEERKEKLASTSIRNKPDLNLDNKEEIKQFGIELDEYVKSLGGTNIGITPEEAGKIQAAIYAKSAVIAAEHSEQPRFQATRPQGRLHRYKDCFSPDFRILQESLHTYINLGRILGRLRDKKHTSILRIRELSRLYPKWRKVYNRYYNKTHPDDHTDTQLFPSELSGISLQQSKQIDIAEKIARIKARLHGRRRMALRAKLSERCRIMQTNMDINKLKKVIQMVIPTARSALDFAALKTEDGEPLKDEMVDREANKVMKTWMSIPGDIHPISREFEDNPEKWRQLLYGTYKPPDSNIPKDLLQQVTKACAQKVHKTEVTNELHEAMHQPFTFEEFNKARLKLTKDKSPGPSGVTNNQMKSWNEKTARTVHELSNIMWQHHSVPQFWQDRLMTLLPKINGVNDLSKIRPISLFENIRKLWAGMVSRRVQSIWHKHNLLHPNQHGFRWQRGTHTAVLHLLNQLELADNTEPTYLTMWDIRRAFDSVPKWLQRLAWARLGMAVDDLEWFLKLDATGNIYIRTPEFELNKEMTKVDDHLRRQLPMLNSSTENQFHPERGIGQGDTPSTLIFIAVFDILLTLLDDSGTGIPNAYADDLAHAAKTQEQQQQQADLVSVFCVVTSLEITTAKVEAIALNHSKFFTTTLVLRDWQWTPHLIVQSDKDFWTRYLGIYLDSEHCDRHYDVAIKQYRAACHALICRTAPCSAKRMVHMMCLRPKIRYIASLAPWSLQQHQNIDKVPYQALCQIYGLRRGFPLALIYAPINVGGCGEIKFSDEVNSMKWKILHSNMHLGGISAEVSTNLIQRALERRRNKMHPRGYVDSLLQWGCEMGLQLSQHSQMPTPHYIVRLRQMLSNQDPTKRISVYVSGGIKVDDTTTTLQRLITPIGRLRTENGIGQIGIYIEGRLTNGVVSRYAIQIKSKAQGTKLSTSFLHELLGIIIGMKATERVDSMTAYSNSKSVVTRVNEVQRDGSQSLLHLPYGPILNAAIHTGTVKNNIQYMPPTRKKDKVDKWAGHRNGMKVARLMAAKPIQEIRCKLINTTIFHESMGEAIDAIIPDGTWIWKNTEGVPNLDSLRANAMKHSHFSYLNRRDTLRNKMDLQQPSRWNRYNMQFATYIADTREKCSARIRGHNCKQMYDWTTHAVNLAKGINDETERAAAAKCMLCQLDKEESQVHTSTTCQHVDLVYIRKVYKKDIDKILEAFKHRETPNEEEWIRCIVNYIYKNLWGETQLTSDIWNGRWTKHMWQEALMDTEVQLKDIDTLNGRKWMKRLTSKLFEAQSAMSRHRFKLTKRLGNPLFERPGGIPRDIKKRLLQEYENIETTMKVKRQKLTKQRNTNGSGLKVEEMSQPRAKKRKTKEDICEKIIRRRAATDLNQPIENTENATTCAIAISRAALSQNNSKRKAPAWTLAQPGKKRTPSRGIRAQDIDTPHLTIKKNEPHKKLKLKRVTTNKTGYNMEESDSYEKRGWQAQRSKNQEKKKAGMTTDSEDVVDYEVDMQIPLRNLNTYTREWLDWDLDTRDRKIQPIESENTSSTREDEWRFMSIISTSIRVDQDENGRLILRSGDYGILLTKEEVTRCVTMVAQNQTMEEIVELLEFEALYNSSTEEFRRTEGEGLCCILALVGTINPQLNSYTEIRARGGRNGIADLIEKIMIPSTRKYTLPEDTHIDQAALERMEYKNHTIEYLEQTALLLRETMDTEVDREKWMYSSSVATVVQAAPYEAAFWKGIGIDRWIALKLWSGSAGKVTKQTIKTVQTVLRSTTRHIASLNSHCFNLENIGPNTYANLINEILMAIVLSKQKDDADKTTLTTDAQTPVKKRVKLDALTNRLPHNTNTIGLSTLTDKTARRGRDTSTRRSKAIKEEDFQEKTNR